MTILETLLAGGAVPLGIRLSDLEILLGSEHLTAVIVGIVLLFIGAELLVRGARELAITFGVPAAVVGVTVVAFATTAPELFVGIVASTDYRANLGLGAIVGSNIANIGLVLGVSALITPLDVSRETIRQHVPFMVLAAVLLVVLGRDGSLGQFDGAVLLGTLGVFTLVLYRSVTGNTGETNAETDVVAADGGVTTNSMKANVVNGLLVLVGLAMLLYGSRELIDGGKNAMLMLGAGDRLVGLAVLALGTSLPELAASLVSAIRGEADFSVGNVVGSNIYNVLAVAGIVAFTSDIMVPFTMRETDFPIMLVFTAVAIATMLYKRRLSRFEGLALVVGYGAFVHFFLL